MDWRLTALALGIVLLGPAIGDWAIVKGQEPAFPADDPFGAAPLSEASLATAPAEPTVTEAVEETAPGINRPSGIMHDAVSLLICAILVFFMLVGFAMVEAGFHSSRHTVNVLFKSVLSLCVGVLAFWCLGYGLMYPSHGANPLAEPNAYLSFGGMGIGSEMPHNAIEGTTNHSQADWLFQMALAVVVAAIVAGGMGGRTKFGAYLLNAAVITAVVYPVCGYWAWGGGWLEQAGFHDAAGSVVIHAMGGFAALAGAIALGPRRGRYTADGKPVSVPGHSLPLAALGVFLLMIGWYGLNIGSEFGLQASGGTGRIAAIAVNTTLAAAAGGVAATFLSWILFSKPDLSLALNGVLAGLVGISAGCDGVSNVSAMIIGAVAGSLAVAGIIALDKLRIDDPVGIFPVHGLCGIWGAVAVVSFADYGADVGTLAAQLQGILFICGWSFGTMFILFAMLKSIGALRVRQVDEEQGLDIAEHGMSAYAA